MFSRKTIHLPQGRCRRACRASRRTGGGTPAQCDLSVAEQKQASPVVFLFLSVASERGTPNLGMKTGGKTFYPFLLLYFYAGNEIDGNGKWDSQKRDGTGIYGSTLR